jgi:hypothetical protein
VHVRARFGKFGHCSLARVQRALEAAAGGRTWEGLFADANKRSRAVAVTAQRWVAALHERQRARKPLSVPVELSGTATD